MYIYLKKSPELEKAIVRLTHKSTEEHLYNHTVWDYQTNPVLSDVIEDFEILNQNPVFKQFLLKATSITYPKFGDLMGRQSTFCRSYGIYHLGKATAELVPSNKEEEKSRYCLSIETSSWEGIPDMKILKERLWAGTITPTVLYDKVQKKQNIFQILSEILNLHNLSPIKRFFLALSLTKVS